MKDPIDALLESYKTLMPKTAYLRKNPKRHSEVEEAVKEISKLALDCDKDAKIEAIPDDLAGTSLCLTITTNLIVIEEIDTFCTALAKANNFEVCPMVDGSISLGICFEDVWVPVDSKNK